MIRNLKIKSRLLLSHGIIILFAVLIALLGLNSINKLNNTAGNFFQYYTIKMIHLGKFAIEYGDIRVNIRDLGNSSTQESNQYFIQEIQGSIDNARNEINQYLALVEGYANYTEQNEYSSLRKLHDAFEENSNIITNKLIPASRQNNIDEVLRIIEVDLIASKNIISLELDNLQNMKIQEGQADLQQAYNASKLSIISISTFLIISVFVAVLLIVTILRSLVGPIYELIDVAINIKKGRLNVNIRDNENDEIGLLAKDFLMVANTVDSIISSIDKMAKAHDEGHIYEYIDETKFEGSYKVVVRKINEMVKSHIQTKKMTIQCLSEIANGNFEANMPSLPGEKRFLNDAVSDLRNKLKGINTEVNELVLAALDGNLSKRVNLSKYNGDWVSVMDNLNNLLNALAEPLNETSSVLQEMSKGNLNVRVIGEYKGDFALIKNSLNITLDEVSSYIREITEVLQQISKNNFNVEITRDFMGQFGDIKESINLIIDVLNNVLGEIGEMVSKVDAISSQVAQSGIIVAQGTLKQSGEVEDLNITINKVREQTNRNSERANKANELSEMSKENAADGNNYMKNMLESMDSIKASSNNISKVIKVIDDIAFQTNLLALNAAVEAARAGVHGKGFAVVAEEVRNLALRSQKAANDTTELIEDTILKVNNGTKIAKTTADSLEVIVESAIEVSSLIEQIDMASSEQAIAISQINDGISQISQIIQNNSAVAEETSSTAEELSNQSEILRKLTNRFELRKM